MAELFGFKIERTKTATTDARQNIVPPQAEDGTQTVPAGGFFASYGGFDVTARNELDLIRRYREVALHPECDLAIEDIISEAIVSNENQQSVQLDLSKIEYSESIKKKIRESFLEVLKLLNFDIKGHDIFRRWYVDGRMYYHKIIDKDSPRLGITELRYIDPRKIKKIREVRKQRTDGMPSSFAFENKFQEYYIFNERGIHPTATSNAGGLRIATDAIAFCPSGLVDQTHNQVLSYLHKAIKPVNQLRMIEDAVVIYRIARAPERRIFYIDVGNLPKGKAEEYLKNIMNQYRNKLVYDAATGELKDDRKHMSMLEDFWLPRREGGRGTEISTLPGGENLGQIDDIIYFQKRLYRSLNVPINRLEQEQQFSLGRSTEINRDELKFQKFIDRLRRKFSQTFLDILKKQLMLKGIITEEDWNEWKNDLVIDYVRDNHFTELKDAELLRERLQTMELVQPYVGEYYSKQYIMKHVLMLSDEDVKDMKKQISDEESSGELEQDEPQNNQQTGDENGDN